MFTDENKNEEPLNVEVPTPTPPLDPAIEVKKVEAENLQTEAEKEVEASFSNEADQEVSPIESTEEIVEAQTSSHSGGGFLIGVLSFLTLGLVFAFYGAMLWGLLSGNTDNPFFDTLGVDAAGLKGVMLNITNGIFGILGLILFCIGLWQFLRYAVLSRNAFNRSKILVKGLTFSFLFIVDAVLWFFLYFLISNSGVGYGKDVDQSLIKTDPAIVIGLSSPVTIAFDVGAQLYEQLPAERIVQINWDFESDGKIDASGPAVTHRFIDRGENEGRFPVSAEIFFIDDNGEETSFVSVREVVISNERILPAFTALPESGPFPLEVEFNASESRDPDGEVILYEWDLDGDGRFELRGEDLVRVEETFIKVGEHTVNLRVTGRNNDAEVVSKKIVVSTPESDLKAVISSVGELTGYAPLKVLLDGSQSFVKEGDIVSFEWFVEGEEIPVLGRKLERVFREPGDYEVTLTVQNDIGERQQVVRTVTVLGEEATGEVVIRTTPALPPKAKILRGTLPFQVTFDASGSDIKNPLEWQWDFENDGLIEAYEEIVSHTFRSPGVYEVSLTIPDGEGGEYVKLFPVLVESLGTKAFISASPASGEIPLKVTFDGSGSLTDKGEIISYSWEVPGAELGNKGAQFDYLFKTVGNFRIGLTILTSEGFTDRTETLVAVRAPSLKADFEASPLAGALPLRVEMSPGISTGFIQEYLWDFGDGKRSRVYSPTDQVHVYEKAGVYTLSLQILDRDGVVSEATKIVNVRGE